LGVRLDRTPRAGRYGCAARKIGPLCVLEAKEFAEQLPRRINRVQKVANRITVGLVLAALIIGAAMMMRIESRFTVLGYPGLPAVLFIFAGSLGLWLVVNIFANDRTPRARHKP
jgi:hypothetical protein